MNGVLLELGDGRYPLTRELGRGNFGEVYAGRDTYLDMPIAVKLFRDDVEFDAVFREARMQARTGEHQHVVTIRNVVAEPPRPYVVMDLCEGSVEQRLEAADVTLVDAVRWTRDGLAGLAHVHSLGIVHRDIKPANWLLREHDRVAVSDFGVADDTVRRIQVDDSIYLAHMAPEVPVGGTSRASDIWAVGCTLYRLLTGQYPFDHDTARIAEGRYVLPHRLNPQVPMSVSRVVERALKVSPAERYPDALGMLAALNDCRVAASWTKVDDPESLETWTASTAGADYRVQLVRRPRAGLELTASKDLRSGAGFRTRRSERPPSVARARQILRGWLVEVVSGRDL